MMTLFVVFLLLLYTLTNMLNYYDRKYLNVLKKVNASLLKSIQKQQNVANKKETSKKENIGQAMSERIPLF